MQFLRSNTGLEDELEADCQLFPEAISTSFLDESCGGDVEEETLPECVGNPGTTRGPKVSVLHTIVFPSMVNRGFSPRTHSWEYPVVFAEFSKR